jgi:hypothetical protein
VLVTEPSHQELLSGVNAQTHFRLKLPTPSEKTAAIAQRPHPESEARLDSEWRVNILGILAALWSEPQN